VAGEAPHDSVYGGGVPKEAGLHMVNSTTRQNLQGLMLVEVFVNVENGYELKALKLRKYEFIRWEEYNYGRDKWRRPTVGRALFIVVVPSRLNQPFKSLLTSQQSQE